MSVLALLLVAPALAWEAAELRPVALGTAFAVHEAWDGAPAWFVGDAEGLRVIDPETGATVTRTDAVRPRVIVVRDLDGVGEAEVVTCGPEGLSLVRGTRSGLAPPRSLSEEPCERLVVYDLEDYPALASVVDGRVISWRPTPQGLIREELGLEVGPAGLLASSGARLGVVRPDGELQLTGPEQLRNGPVIALGAASSGFVWLTDGALHLSGTAPTPLDAPATGVVTEGGRVWLLDGPGRQLTVFGQRPSLALPVAPDAAAVTDVNGDGCPDLLLGSASGEGALLVGRCDEASETLVVPIRVEEPERVSSVEVPPIAPGQLHRAAAEIVLGATWPVLDVVAGEALATRFVGADGVERRWASRGGPPGFSVLRDGVVDYVAEDEDVGRWRTSVRATSPLWAPRWSGIVVQVWPEGTPIDDGGESPWVAPPRTPLFPGLEGFVGVGVAGGVAKTDGVTWEHLGTAATRAAVSPMGSILVTAGRRPLHGFFGVDSAPLFRYPSTPEDRIHGFATTIGLDTGSETTRVGAFGTWGWSSGGLGVRAASTPFRHQGHPSGVELRAWWLAPQLGGEASLCWIVGL